MGNEKILLDPVDFMALHLSSLANNGIGRELYEAGFTADTQRATFEEYIAALNIDIKEEV
jgi:hypothetical protein